MITLFTVLMVVFILKSLGLAFRLSWSLLKVCFVVLVIPALLIGLLFTVISKLAIPALIVAGIVLLLREGRKPQKAEMNY